MATTKQVKELEVSKENKKAGLTTPVEYDSDETEELLERKEIIAKILKAQEELEEAVGIEIQIDKESDDFKSIVDFLNTVTKEDADANDPETKQ